MRGAPSGASRTDVDGHDALGSTIASCRCAVGPLEPTCSRAPALRVARPLTLPPGLPVQATLLRTMRPANEPKERKRSCVPRRARGPALALPRPHHARALPRPARARQSSQVVTPALLEGPALGRAALHAPARAPPPSGRERRWRRDATTTATGRASRRPQRSHPRLRRGLELVVHAWVRACVSALRRNSGARCRVAAVVVGYLLMILDRMHSVCGVPPILYTYNIIARQMCPSHPRRALTIINKARVRWSQSKGYGTALGLHRPTDPPAPHAIT